MAVRVSGFNLASADYHGLRRGRLVRLAATALLGVALVVQLAVWAGLHRGASGSGARLAEMAQQVAQQEARVRTARAAIPAEALKSYEAKVAALNKILEASAFSWTGLLLELERSVPPGVELREIQPDPTTGKVTLTGLGRDFEDVSRLVHSLSERPGFREVDLLRQAERKPTPGQRPGLSFTVSLIYQGRPQ